MRRKPKIGIVMGTRPEIIKNYSVVRALKSRGVNYCVLHTNQHTDKMLHQAIFEQLGYDADFVLSGKYSIGKAIDWVRGMIRQLELELIIVNGDTAAALVGAIAALYSDVGIAHVEAGLRSYDPEMYEERNRIMVDAVAHYLFAYTEFEKECLSRKKDLRGRIFCVGNTTIDLISDFQDRLTRPLTGRYAYVTLHRKEFTDRKNAMLEVFRALDRLSDNFDKIVFPVHPRTQDAIGRYDIPKDLMKNFTLLEPISVFESLAYEKHADIIMTDSGSIQEEAYIFGVPCLTLRENTERHGTVQMGANIVAGLVSQDIQDAARVQLNKGPGDFPPIYGVAGAGERIVDIILERFHSFREY
jgi:UDP-N-acetylglucosamine 2-epimerase (non-hydrolysing)